jgi:predicted nucleotidyltransferase
VRGTSRAIVNADQFNVRFAILDPKSLLPNNSFVFESEIAPVRSRLIAAGVSRIGIFGSYSRGEARPDSDVDVFMDFRPGLKTYDNFIAVGDALEEALHRKVELVTEKGLGPYIGPKIMREVKYVDLGA